jgi:acetyltransferase-like isoleucine patch superfamily enzyme
MNREEFLKNQPQEKTYNDMQLLHQSLFTEFKKQFNRTLPFTDEVFDRWERARKLGWGEGSSVYDSSYIFGEVRVGKKCWIGPFTIIDGSGGLSIGDHCTISTGVHIYTHDNLKQTLSGGKLPIEHEAVSIGSCTYIGPQSMITKGVSIGSHCVVASNSFVNKNVEDNAIVAGNPAKVIGRVIVKENNIEFDYDLK